MGNRQSGVDQGVLWIEWGPHFFATGRDHNTRKRSNRTLPTAYGVWALPQIIFSCQNSVGLSKNHLLSTTPFCPHDVGVDTFLCQTTTDHPILFIMHSILSKGRPLLFAVFASRKDRNGNRPATSHESFAVFNFLPESFSDGQQKGVVSWRKWGAV